MPPTHDESLASKTEAWIVDQLVLMEYGQGVPQRIFLNGVVEVFRGTTHPTGEELIAEMTANRSPYGAVLFEGDRAIQTQEGQQDYEPVYAIYIVVQNKRDGAARKGDGNQPGTNGIRDAIRQALHDQSPAVEARGYYAQRAEFRGVSVVFQRKDAFIMRAEVVVREVPVAV